MLFAIEQNKREGHCHQMVSARCKLILLTGEKQNITIPGGNIPRERSFGGGEVFCGVFCLGLLSSSDLTF